MAIIITGRLLYYIVIFFIIFEIKTIVARNHWLEISPVPLPKPNPSNDSSAYVYITKDNRTIIDVEKVMAHQKIFTTRTQMAGAVFFFLFMVIPLTGITILICLFRCCVWCYQKHISAERRYKEPRLEDIEKMEKFLLQCLREEQVSLALKMNNHQIQLDHQNHQNHQNHINNQNYQNHQHYQNLQNHLNQLNHLNPLNHLNHINYDNHYLHLNNNYHNFYANRKSYQYLKNYDEDEEYIYE